MIVVIAPETIVAAFFSKGYPIPPPNDSLLPVRRFELVITHSFQYVEERLWLRTTQIRLENAPNVNDCKG